MNTDDPEVLRRKTWAAMMRLREQHESALANERAMQRICIAMVVIIIALGIALWRAI